MYRLFKFILFLLPPERAHHVTMLLLDIATRTPIVKTLIERYGAAEAGDPVVVAGLQFKNRVGLAAGFDKNGLHIRSLAMLGFGHIEVGTVTPLPQDGNPLPRLFRLPKDQALINRMGFNNLGVKALKARLEEVREICRRRNIIIGANIGKNKSTPNQSAIDDYLICFRELYDVADYFVVNVSSPNTPDLRALQDKEPLMNILGTLQQENKAKPVCKPIFLKIAPDLTYEQIVDIAEIVQKTGIAGVVATNTTTGRSGLRTAPKEVERMGAGGLSGAPISEHATRVQATLRKLLADDFAIIGVGGIQNVADARKKLTNGAQLVQLYSGFVYHGPALVREINKEL